MSEQVKVSIVTRTKNRSDFLKRARNGLAAQTFKDFEWIVVNDGGNTKDIDTILASPIKAIHGTNRIDLTETRGRAGAAIVGLNAAKGTYCLLHDDDDALLPNALHAFVSEMEAAPKAVAVIGGTKIITEKLKKGTYMPYGREKTSIPKQAPLLIDLAYRNSFLTIATLFRRNAYETIGGINPDLDVLEDWDLWLKLMLIGDVIALPELLSVQYIRKDAQGDAAQSKRDDHVQASIAMRNHYLRQDIHNGSFGLGKLMNTHHRQTLEELAAMTKSLKHIKNIMMFWRSHEKN